MAPRCCRRSCGAGGRLARGTLRNRDDDPELNAAGRRAWLAQVRSWALRLSSMPRTTASRWVLSVVARFLKKTGRWEILVGPQGNDVTKRLASPAALTYSGHSPPRGATTCQFVSHR